MIRAEFHKTADGFQSVQVSGHAGYADHGSDVACASVTSAVQMAANGITEILSAPAKVEVLDDETITIALEKGSGQGAEIFLAALHLHLKLLSEEYTGHIKLTVLEV